MTEDATERLDRLADKTAEQLNAFRRKLLEATGDRPFGSEKLTHAQKLERIGAIWDDDAAWREILSRERQALSLGPDAAPKRLLKEAQELGAEGGEGLSGRDLQ